MNKHVEVAVVGVPARVVGWVSRDGERLEFGADNEAVCPAMGERYRRTGDNCVELVKQ
jgi:UDP-2-acetamido-3-amino-2,3-dideoxy-glucuronate N-acetyltransferase